MYEGFFVLDLFGIYFGDTTPVMSQIKGFLKELGKLTEDADMSEKYDKATYKAIK